jgi:hypothetical protein
MALATLEESQERQTLEKVYAEIAFKHLKGVPLFFFK